jgi:hypothetical protein
MKAKLRKDSWHSWLYQRMYAKYDLPVSLCNYFWPVLFALPLFIIFLPSILMDVIGKYWTKNKTGMFVLDGLINRLFSSIWFYFMGFLLINYIRVWIDHPGLLGVIHASVLFLVILCIAIYRSRNKISRKMQRTYYSVVGSDAVTMVKAQTVATKDKICPKIEWV